MVIWHGETAILTSPTAPAGAKKSRIDARVLSGGRQVEILYTPNDLITAGGDFYGAAKNNDIRNYYKENHPKRIVLRQASHSLPINGKVQYSMLIDLPFPVEERFVERTLNHGRTKEPINDKGKTLFRYPDGKHKLFVLEMTGTEQVNFGSRQATSEMDESTTVI